MIIKEFKLTGYTTENLIGDTTSQHRKTDHYSLVIEEVTLMGFKVQNTISLPISLEEELHDYLVKFAEKVKSHLLTTDSNI